MNILRRTILIGIIASVTFASSAAATDRATLADNNWNGMTASSVHSGISYYGDDLLQMDRFRHPASVLAMPDGSVLIADTVNQVIKQVKDGEVALFGGVNLLLNEKGLPVGSLVDGDRLQSAFNLPTGLDHDAAGNIYVADAGNHAIRKISVDGQVTTIAGDGVLGYADGSGAEARFYYPTDVAVADDGTIYVADTLNHVIRKIAPDGQVSTLNALSERVVEIASGVIEESGDYRDGPLAQALFNEPSGLALDAKGNLYVSDTGNQRIRYIDFATNTVTTAAGAVYVNVPQEKVYKADALYAEGFYQDGPALEALFYAPKGIALDEQGGLLIADSENHVIRYLKDGRVTTVAGQPEQYGATNGIEKHNQLYRPVDVTVTADGKMLIADSFNNVIRQVEVYQLPEQVLPSSNVQVVYDDQLIVFDAKPEVVNGRTMVPVRMIAEAAGYDVEFVGTEQRIVMKSDQQTIEFTIGRTDLTVRYADGSEVRQDIDVAPYIRDDRTYVPVRFFSEVAGKDVAWIAEQRIVVIRDKVQQP